MSVSATVLIPTFDHGPLLRFAVESACAQTVREIEVFIVGDGATDEGRRVAREFERHDDRVRFFDNPKAARHGEASRDAALLEASGEIVCYLSDDDLWFDDHVETMLGLLVSADLAHTLGSSIDTHDELHVFDFDVTLPLAVDALRRVELNVPLSAWAHRLDAYRRLADRWSPAPPGIPTDINMWLKFIDQSWLRTASSPLPTSLHLPSADPQRRGWPNGRRIDELRKWRLRLSDNSQAAELRSALLTELMKDATRRSVQAMSAESHRLELQGTLDDTRSQLASVSDELARTRVCLHDFETEVQRLRRKRLRSRAIRVIESIPRVGTPLADRIRRFAKLLGV